MHAYLLCLRCYIDKAFTISNFSVLFSGIHSQGIYVKCFHTFIPTEGGWFVCFLLSAFLGVHGVNLVNAKRIMRITETPVTIQSSMVNRQDSGGSAPGLCLCLAIAKEWRDILTV